ncbi:MAG: cysteine--tRNA ligase [Bacteroidota bacterium]
MTFRLFNTLSRSVEPIEPAEPNHLRFYGCGPTVYSYAHIGNFRSFLTADLILRTAQAIGWETTYVSNITDVGHLTEDDLADASGEDKMAKALKSKEGEAFANVYDLARYYADALIADWHALNLHEPTVRPRATEHVTQQIDAVEQLLAKGHAYETENAVYFSVDSFGDYGKLSGNAAADALEAAVRDVVVDSDKRDPRDFALWKKDPKHLMQWYSPFGRGFPGWHIECSVMAREYLGDSFDLHTGGEDLIFPHHECEIAQSECLTGQPFARYWAHTRFLQVEGEKMSKSKGNFYTLRDLIAPESEGGKDVDPLAVRYTLISGQYRKPFNFTLKTLKASAKHVQRFQALDEAVAAALDDPQPGDDTVGKALTSIYDRVLGAMLDDLNTPAALAAALGGVKMLENRGDLNGASAEAAKQWLDNVNDLLGIVRPLSPREVVDEVDPMAAEVEALIAERNAARKAKDFARADAIRNDLAERGIDLMDTPTGTTWSKRTF